MKRRTIAWIAGSALLAGFSAHAAWGYVAERGWEHRLEELQRLAAPAAARRAARAPETLALWERFAELDQRVWELAPDTWAERGYACPDGTPLAPDREAELRSLLSRVDEALEAWSAICCEPGFRAAEERGDLFAPDVQKLQRARNWADLLAWKACFEAREHDPGAEATLASILDLGRIIDDGTMLGSMIRLAIDGIATRAARDLLAHGLLDPERLQAAFDSRLELAIQRPPREVLEHELLWACENIGAVGGHSTPPRWVEGPWGSISLHGYFEPAERVLELARLSTADFLAVQAPLDAAQSIDRLTWARMTRGFLASAHYLASRMTLARVALAIAARRAEQGAPPASLDELAPFFPEGVPLDASSREPFPYEVVDGVARLGPSAWARLEEQSLDWPAAVERGLAWEL